MKFSLDIYLAHFQHNCAIYFTVKQNFFTGLQRRFAFFSYLYKEKQMFSAFEIKRKQSNTKDMFPLMNGCVLYLCNPLLSHILYSHIAKIFFSFHYSYIHVIIKGSFKKLHNTNANITTSNTKPAWLDFHSGDQNPFCVLFLLNTNNLSKFIALVCHLF